MPEEPITEDSVVEEFLEQGGAFAVDYDSERPPKCPPHDAKAAEKWLRTKAKQLLEEGARSERERIANQLKTTGRDIKHNNLLLNEIFRNGYIRANTDILKMLAAPPNNNQHE